MKDLVLLHGWGMSSGVFDPLRRALAPGCHAQAMDLPGYRGSANAEPYTLDALARRLAEAAPPRCAVLGWSLGALVALAWAAQSPEQVEKLVIVAGTPCFVQREDWPHGLEPAVLCSFGRELASDRERTLRRFTALQARGDENSKDVTRALGAASSDAADVSNAVLDDGLRMLRDTDLRPLLIRDLSTHIGHSWRARRARSARCRRISCSESARGATRDAEGRSARAVPVCACAA